MPTCGVSFRSIPRHGLSHHSSLAFSFFLSFSGQEGALLVAMCFMNSQAGSPIPSSVNACVKRRVLPHNLFSDTATLDIFQTFRFFFPLLRLLLQLFHPSSSPSFHITIWSVLTLLLRWPLCVQLIQFYIFWDAQQFCLPRSSPTLPLFSLSSRSNSTAWLRHPHHFFSSSHSLLSYHSKPSYQSQR